MPNTVVQSLLGRLPPGGLATGNTTVQLVDNGDNRLYADNRRTQIDMRFAKILRFGSARAPTSAWTCTTCSTPTTRSATRAVQLHAPNGGTWLNPNSILPPRFARFNLTFNF